MMDSQVAFPPLLAYGVLEGGAYGKNKYCTCILYGNCVLRCQSLPNQAKSMQSVQIISKHGWMVQRMKVIHRDESHHTPLGYTGRALFSAEDNEDNIEMSGVASKSDADAPMALMEVDMMPTQFLDCFS